MLNWPCSILNFCSVGVKRKLFQVSLLYLAIFMMTGCDAYQDARFNRSIREGDVHFERREYAQALSTWEKALSIRPETHVLYGKIGRTYLRLADIDRAKEAFQQAIRLGPEALDVRLELAKLHLLSRDLAAAEESRKALVKLGVNDPALHEFDGDLKIMTYLLDDAALSYRKALDIDPGYQPARIKLAICKLSQGRIEEADRIFRTVATLEAKSPVVMLQIGHYWIADNVLAEADGKFGF